MRLQYTAQQLLRSRFNALHILHTYNRVTQAGFQYVVCRMAGVSELDAVCSI